jgi:hypothetical protein
MTGPRNAAFVRHVAALAVALIGVLLLAASAARAGEWAQVGCTQPNGQPAPIEGWTPEAVNGPGNYSSAHVASVGRRIFFGGVLHGGPIPPAGKQLVLEARSTGSRWIEARYNDAHGACGYP